MAEDDSSQLGEIRSPPLQSAAHSIIYGLGGGGRVQLLPQSHGLAKMTKTERFTFHLEKLSRADQ